MSLTLVFQCSLYVLVALAGGMLAIGEETFFPAGLTVLLAGLALFFNERSVRLSLGPLVGNLLGLAALGAAGYEFFGESADSRLLACGHFLVYITWIVLLQAKGVRQYWWLCALSLLQVAIGSVLTNSTGSYGLLLLAYLLLALWTLSVFTLYQGASEFGGLDTSSADSTSGADLAGNGLPNLRDAFLAERRSTVRNAIQQDYPGRWIVPRFIWGVLGLSATGLALGLTLFLLVPRVWIGSGGMRYQGESSGAQAVVGFSAEIRLGQIGQILESTERVMQVRLFDLDDEKLIDLDNFAAEYGLSAPLFRGSVLEHYENGRWKGPREKHLATMHSPRRSETGLIRQEYTLDLLGSEVLFAMRPFSRARLADPKGIIHVNDETAVVAGSLDDRNPIKYYIYSSKRKSGEAVSDGSEFGEMPGFGMPGFGMPGFGMPGFGMPGFGMPGFSTTGPKRLSPYLTARYLQRPDSTIDRLAELAQALAQSAQRVDGTGASSERRTALALEAHLRDSDQYAYTLNMAVEDPSRDPVEEFLFVRRRGHCEYFASALALMLRSVQIPARLVTGFKGADFHLSEGYYEVQQRHGHVWIEAFVDGQWIVLDPTPAARDEAVRNIASNASFWQNARTSISSLWSTYVVSLTLNRQQQTLYDPLQGSVSSSWGSLSSLLRRAGEGVAWAKGTLSSSEQFLSPGGATLGLAVLALAWLFIRYARRGLRGAHRALRASRPHWARRALAWLAMKLTGRRPDPAGMLVEFYEQFLSLMKAAGLARREDQTQREFARHVEEALSDRLAAFDLSQFPSELAELFYRVRFGAGRLEAFEVGSIEQRLGRLEAALAPR